MSYATDSDVVLRLGRNLTTAESQRVDVLLDDASAVVDGYCGRTFTTAPTAVVGVVAKMVARSFGRAASGGEFVDQETAGPFTTHFAAAVSGGDVWLSAADKLALRSARRGGGLSSVQFVGERYDISSSSSSSFSS